MGRSDLDFRRRSARGLLLAASLLVCACASKLPRTPQTFTIDAPEPRPVPPATATRVVSLRRAEVAPTYAGANLVYRIGPHDIERDPYASLAASPAWIVTSAIRGYLRDVEFIRDVVSPGDGAAVDAEIEPGLTELAGDFSNPSEPAASLTLQFRVLTPASGATAARERFLKSYSRRIPLSQRTAAAVVAAWNRALGEIMREFLADLKGVLPPGS